MAVASAGMDEVVVQVLVSIPGEKRKLLPIRDARFERFVHFGVGRTPPPLFSSRVALACLFFFVRRAHVRPAAHAMSPRIPPAMMAIGAGTW